MNVYRKHSRIWKLTFAVVMVLLLAVSLAFSSGIYADSGSDISEPKAVGGVYQIGSEGELRWFASLVNGELDGVTAVPDAKAKLTADIDLSGSEFFSIGGG